MVSVLVSRACEVCRSAIGPRPFDEVAAFDGEACSGGCLDGVKAEVGREAEVAPVLVDWTVVEVDGRFDGPVDCEAWEGSFCGLDATRGVGL